MSAKNNFTKEETKTQSRYKLWVCYQSFAIENRLPEKKVYYSYEKKGFPEYGLNRLLKLVQERKQKIKMAILYDNINNRELKKFSSESLTMIDI